MSAATRAKTAKERAQIAAQIIRAGRASGRALSDCLEMGDGNEVIAHLHDMVKRSPKLRANISRYLSGFMFYRDLDLDRNLYLVRDETGKEVFNHADEAECETWTEAQGRTLAPWYTCPSSTRSN